MITAIVEFIFLSILIYFAMWLFSNKDEEPGADKVALKSKRRKTAMIIAVIITVLLNVVR